jgi:hypothetical protein
MADFSKIPDKTEYEVTEYGVIDKQVIIGSQDVKFLPNANFSFRFDAGIEHKFININYEDMLISTEQEGLTGNELSIVKGSETVKFHIDKQNRVFKFDIICASKPQKSRWRFKMTHSDDVRFLFQDTLENEYLIEGDATYKTEQEYLDAHSRPEDVIGSYAVYCDLWGEVRNQKREVLFSPRTGKLMHIFRPWVRDNNDSGIWAEYELTIISETEKYLDIIIPSDWLEKAAYPVTIDPDLGDSTCGGSSNRADQETVARSFTSSEAGDITDIGSCAKNTSSVGTREFYMSAYQDAGGGNDSQLLAEVTRTLSISEDDCTDGTGATETYSVNDHPDGSSDYWIANSGNDGKSARCYDFDADSVKKVSGEDHPASQDWSAAADSSYKIDVWVVYTTAAGALEININDTVTITENVDPTIKALNIDVNDTVTVQEALD